MTDSRQKALVTLLGPSFPSGGRGRLSAVNPLKKEKSVTIFFSDNFELSYNNNICSDVKATM